MTYLEWCKSHQNKHNAIMQKLVDLSDDEVIEYFYYENMQKNEPLFCPLYALNQKCHDMQNLNCYLCACPHFRFDDMGIKKVEEKTLFSTCAIGAKKGKVFESESALHHDCTNCCIPHEREFIKQSFERDWHYIMEKTSKNILWMC